MFLWDYWDITSITLSVFNAFFTEMLSSILNESSFFAQGVLVSEQIESFFIPKKTEENFFFTK